MPSIPGNKPFWTDGNYHTLSGLVKDQLVDLEKIYRGEKLTSISWNNCLKNNDELQNIPVKIEEKKLFFIVPAFANERIYLQQGLFMIPWILDKSEYEKYYRSYVTTIKVHKNLRNRLLDYLEKIGCSMLILMPDLANVGLNVTKKFL